MTHCVFQHDTEQVSIRSFGNALEYNPLDTQVVSVFSTIATLVRASYEKEALPERVIWQRLPGPHHIDCSKNIVVVDNKTRANQRGWVEMNSSFIRGDATVIGTPGMAVVKTSRDCPYLVLWSENGGPVVVLHCGRDQLHDVREGNVMGSVIHNVLDWMRGEHIDLTSVRGAITMGISAEHFNNERYPEITSSLKTAWGDNVVPDTERQTIDLKELILEQCEAFGGIQRESIMHDGLDTFTDPRLASLRGGPSGHQRHNLILVIRKH